MSLKKLFGKHLKSIRERHNLTQQELADLLGMQPNSIGQVEIGYKGVSFRALENMAEKLNMEYYEFFDFDVSVCSKNNLSKAVINEIENLDVDTQRYVLNSVRGLVKLLKNQNQAEDC